MLHFFISGAKEQLTGETEGASARSKKRFLNNQCRAGPIYAARRRGMAPSARTDLNRSF